jgi:hypothetical protein
VIYKMDLLALMAEWVISLKKGQPKLPKVSPMPTALGEVGGLSVNYPDLDTVVGGTTADATISQR